MAELEDLLHVPQFERILHHKVEELKLYLHDEISLYRDLRKQFRKSTYGKLTVAGEEKSTGPQVYRFHLEQMQPGEWSVMELEPTVFADIGTYGIIPREIIKHISHYPPNPVKIEELSNFVHPYLEGRFFNICFARYSDAHIFGTISELEGSAGPAAEDSVPGVVDIEDAYAAADPGTNMHELSVYMKKYPQLREHLLAEFYLKWKPLLEKKLL